MERYREILAFWFGPGSGAKLWFSGDPATDRAVQERFSADVADAVAGRLPAWEDYPESTVALVVLLDQFSLQLHRKQRRGYEQAALALPIVERALAKGFDRQLACEERGFLYMPFMHAEDLGRQDRSVTLFSTLAAECGGRAGMTGFLRSAEQHREVVMKYGRFPGRNEAYGRATTAEERVYLDRGGYF
jgi:uncharacterized protein (DUF924 family)